MTVRSYDVDPDEHGWVVVDIVGGRRRPLRLTRTPSIGSNNTMLVQVKGCTVDDEPILEIGNHQARVKPIDREKVLLLVKPYPDIVIVREELVWMCFDPGTPVTVDVEGDEIWTVSKNLADINP